MFYVYVNRSTGCGITANTLVKITSDEKAAQKCAALNTYSDNGEECSGFVSDHIL